MIDGSVRLAEALAEAGVSARLVVPGTPTPTVATAALALGCRPSQIVKSVVFERRPPSGPRHAILVVASGTSRVDPVRLASVLGLARRRVRIASASLVEAATGFPVGGVPPIGHPQALPTLIDRAVLDERTVYGGGGDDRTLLEIEVGELLRVCRPAIVDVSAG